MIQATNAQIAQAIKTGNLRMLKKLVESGNQFKKKHYDLTDGNNNALILAVEHGQFDVVKWLVEVCKQPIYSRAETNIIPDGRSRGTAKVYEKPECGDAAVLSIKKNRPEIMKWLFENSCTQGYSHLTELELLVRQDNFELFKWLFAHVGRQDAYDMYIAYAGLLSSAPFDWIKWMITVCTDGASARDFWRILARRESHKDCLAMIKWMVEDSGFIVDCEDWDDSSSDISPQHVDIMQYCGAESLDYIRSVKQSQDMLGLENWFEGMQGKRKRDASKQRRKL